MRASELGIALLRWLAFTVLLLALLFGLTGRSDLPMFWAYAATQSALALAVVLTIDPGLARERRHPGPGGIDRMRGPTIGFLFLSHIVIAALDVGHFHWSDSVPLLAQIAALGTYTTGMGLAAWAMAVNRFFSPVVRIQEERGHRLVTAGPYRFVRHPGYLGMCAAFPASAVALGSWYALLPAAACALAVVRRAVLEDRYLLENLLGYCAYAEGVRFRLVPLIW